MSIRVRLFSLCTIAALAAACGSSPSSPAPLDVPYSQTDLQVGTGATAVVGSQVDVNYSLWLYSTTAADHKGSLIQANKYSFVVGAGQVIPGWDQGVPGMRVGGVRRLVLPPNLAYGSAGAAPDIPPNATLVFDIELLAVR
jgi:FKBP-type peptidyl-prolyl cis-trans isomerase FkpA